MNEIAAHASTADADAAIVRFRLNEIEQVVSVDASHRLIDLLREQFGLIAAKAACRIGRCGSCLVMVDGRAVNSCLMMAWQLGGADIMTAEGIVALPEGRAVHAALMAEVAFQCGYCAPGFTIALTALFRREPVASDETIRAALAGNLCRCTGYLSILRGAAAARDEISRQHAHRRDTSPDPATEEHHHVDSSA